MSQHLMRSDSPKSNRARIWEVLSVLGATERVELKVTVPETDYSSAVAALEMDVLDAELRQVVFFDTPDLALNRRGLAVRARRIRQGGDVTVKLRPLLPAMLSRKLLQPEQRALYMEHAPRGLDLDSLMAFGPMTVAKLKVSPKGLGGRSVAAEMWFFPDASRILELSTKCGCGDAYQVAAETRTFLTHRGVTLTGRQDTKTRRALEYFAHLHASTGRFKHTTPRKHDR